MKFTFMKKICLFLFIMLVSLPICIAQNSNTNQERLKKYWYLRWRLKNYFMVVGDCYGCSLPASIRNNWAEPQFINNEQYWSSGMKFGDAPNYLSSYIGILATEYKLLSDNNQYNSETLRELYYAIKAINRLDECEAQYPWNKNTNNLDGLCSRGDVDTGFVRSHYNELNQNLGNFNPLSQGDPLEVKIGSNYDYNKDISNNDDQEAGIMSQDHISSMLVGLALVKKFIPSGTTYNGMDIHDEAKQITKRIIDYMQRCNWHLENPEGAKILEGWGSKAWPYSYGFAKAATFIWPQHAADFAGVIPLSNKVTWDAIATAYLDLTDFCTILGNNGVDVGECENSRNAWIILNLAAVGNSWETVPVEVSLITIPALAPLAAACLLPGLDCSQGLIWQHAKVYGWEAYYPLLHATLHNSGCLTSRSQIEADLNSMPCTGHWGDMGPAGWSAPNKYHQIPAENNIGDPGFAGQYSGLEFMLLHNLYYLHGNNKDSEGNTLPQYQNLMDITLDNDFPYVFIIPPATPVMLGSHVTPFTVNSFSTITYDKIVNPTGEVTFRAGKSIEFPVGFEVKLGGKFEATIDPFSCSSNTYARLANDSTQADSSDTKKGDKGPDNSNDDFLYGMQNLPFKSNRYVPVEPVKEEPVVQTKLAEIEKTVNSDTSPIGINPNPSRSGVFQLSISDDSQPLVTVYNPLGEIVYYSFARSTQHTIDISTQPKGVYFVKLRTAEKISVQKVVYQ